MTGAEGMGWGKGGDDVDGRGFAVGETWSRGLILMRMDDLSRSCGTFDRY